MSISDGAKDQDQRPRRTAASPRPDTYVRVSSGVGGGRPRERPADCSVNKGARPHNLTITITITIAMTASGRHLRTEYGLLSRCTIHVARCTIHVARCTPALDSSGPCSRTKLLHDVGCSASERSCESMGERQGRTWTSSVEPKCVVPVLGLASVLVLARVLALALVLGGAR